MQDQLVQKQCLKHVPSFTKMIVDVKEGEVEVKDEIEEIPIGLIEVVEVGVIIILIEFVSTLIIGAFYASAKQHGLAKR